eukprot:4408945-Amphidinium_carterae.1
MSPQHAAKAMHKGHPHDSLDTRGVPSRQSHKCIRQDRQHHGSRRNEHACQIGLRLTLVEVQDCVIM